VSKVIYKTRIPVRQYSTEYNPIVYSGGELSISYYTETGKFDLFSNEVSTKCHVYINKDGKRFKSISIDAEEGSEYNDTDIDEVIYLFDQDERMHWIDTASSKKQAIRNFINVHREKIEYGNAVTEINKLTKEIADKTDRLAFLADYVKTATTPNTPHINHKEEG